MAKNNTLVKKICDAIVAEPVTKGFEIPTNFDHLPVKYAAKIGYVMEEYIHYWLSNNDSLRRITTKGSYEDRVFEKYRKNVSILDNTNEFQFIDEKNSPVISFDGLYLSQGINVPIEVKSGNMNGYLKHLDKIQSHFYSMFGKGKFVHPVFMPFREDTIQYIKPKLEKAVEDFPELAFIDISDLVYEVQVAQQELTGSTAKIKEPYMTPNSMRTYVCLGEKVDKKKKGRSRKQKALA